MLLETIIGLGLLVFLLWKYIFTNKSEQIQCEKVEPVQQVPSVQKQNEADAPVENVAKESCFITKEKIIDSLETRPQVLVSQKCDTDIQNIISFKTDELITPSILLKQRHEKLLSEKQTKRESPPKEKLAEFLEKTILSDDKIQSIIQNLSLDKTEILIHEEPAKVLYPTSKDIIPLAKEEGYTLSEKAVTQQGSIDNIADRIRRLNINNIVKEPTETNILSEGPIVDKVEEKPLLKRLQTQPGFPPGLNFGSVIGELKNKTKNGGLKPVFKKFDVDTVDNAQAGFLTSLLKY